MAGIPHALPSDAGPAGDAARRLLRLVGPAYQAPDESNNAADALALGGSVADLQATVRRAIDQIFPDTASDLLPELEALYLLPDGSSMSLADRQTRLLAWVRAGFSGSPQDIQTALRTLDPSAAVIEDTYASLATMTSEVPMPMDVQRCIFRFAVKLSHATFIDPVRLGPLVLIVERMKPAHTTWTFCEHTGPFLCDDPASLTDDTLLGG